MEFNPDEIIELIREDRLLPEQLHDLSIYMCSNTKLREIIIRLEEKGLAQYVHSFNRSGTVATTLPKEIALFSNLRRLNLNYARDLLSLPSWIGQLSKLEELTIYYNKNIKSLPPEIGQLRNLRTLSITNCALTELPPEIGQLESLEHLDLSSNQLTTLPPEIGNLRNLKVLNVGSNPLELIPEEIGKLNKLEVFYECSGKRPEWPTSMVLLKNCYIDTLREYRVAAGPLLNKYIEIRKEAAKYAVASRLMVQGTRTMPDSAARAIFSMPELRSHIASFVGWHSSFNRGQPNAGFAYRFEAQQQQRTAITEYDFLTKIIQPQKP